MRVERSDRWELGEVKPQEIRLLCSSTIEGYLEGLPAFGGAGGDQGLPAKLRRGFSGNHQG